MMAKQEKETRKHQQLIEKSIVEEYIQLPAWDRLQVRLFIKWLKFRHLLRKIAWNWLLFQWKLDEAIKALIKKRR